jgi:hypothetical protein
MENKKEHYSADSSDEDKKNVMMKYLKVIVMQNPFYNYFQYGNKVNSILEELEKTYIKYNLDSYLKLLRDKII